MQYALTYDDIQLVPAFSNIKSRTNINLRTMLSRRYGLLNTIVASPMEFKIKIVEFCFNLSLFNQVC